MCLDPDGLKVLLSQLEPTKPKEKVFAQPAAKAPTTEMPVPQPNISQNEPGQTLRKDSAASSLSPANFGVLE